MFLKIHIYKTNEEPHYDPIMLRVFSWSHYCNANVSVLGN